MDALSLLLNRHSQARLTEPAPQGEVLENIKMAALKTPDHASLKPWHFIVCEGKGREKLGNIFEKSAIENDKSATEIERAPLLPLRAPMVVVAIAKYTEHEKVPRVEQVASTACAVMAMQMAAMAQGFNGIWRTGNYAHCALVKAELALAEEDEIVGFLYLGTPTHEALPRPTLKPDDYFSVWN